MHGRGDPRRDGGENLRDVVGESAVPVQVEVTVPGIHGVAGVAGHQGTLVLRHPRDLVGQTVEDLLTRQYVRRRTAVPRQGRRGSGLDRKHVQPGQQRGPEQTRRRHAHPASTPRNGPSDPADVRVVTRTRAGSTSRARARHRVGGAPRKRSAGRSLDHRVCPPAGEARHAGPSGTRALRPPGLRLAGRRSAFRPPAGRRPVSVDRRLPPGRAFPPTGHRKRG